jgi:hypothetical protein
MSLGLTRRLMDIFSLTEADLDPSLPPTMVDATVNDVLFTVQSRARLTSVLADRDGRSGRRVADGDVAAAGVTGAPVIAQVGCGAAIAQHGFRWQRFFCRDEFVP